MPVFPLDDVSPWPVSDGAHIRWDSGWAAFVVASSSCVRVNKRGIYAKPSYWSPVENLQSMGWNTKQCAPASGSFCAQGNWTVFPVEPNVPAYNPKFTLTGEEWNGCSRDDDGRALEAVSKAYDISSCDVLDGGWDVLLVDNTLAFKNTAIDTWIYWTLCLLVIYVVRSLSYLVVLRMHPTEDQKACSGRPKPTNTVKLKGAWGGTVAVDMWTKSTNARTAGACLLTWVLCVLPVWNTVYVTVEEQLFFLGVSMYVLFYAIMWYMSTHTEDPPLYNMIVATVLLAVTRLYTGAETPYTPVLMWAVGTRTLMKLRNTYWSRIVATTVMLDSFLLSLLAVLGFEYSHLYLILIGALALLASDVLEMA